MLLNVDLRGPRRLGRLSWKYLHVLLSFTRDVEPSNYYHSTFLNSKPNKCFAINDSTVLF